MKKCNSKNIFISLGVLITLFFGGCGGGTVGTSDTGTSGRFVQGSLRLSDGEPIANATMNLTDDDNVVIAQTETDSGGRFSMSAGLQSEYALRIFQQNNQYQLVVPSFFTSDSIISSDVTFSSNGEVLSTTIFEVSLNSIEGCGTFSGLNLSFILLEDFKSCVVDISVKKDGVPAQNVLIAVKTNDAQTINFNTNAGGSVTVRMTRKLHQGGTITIAPQDISIRPITVGIQ